jgi:hypothetical protein
MQSLWLLYSTIYRAGLLAGEIYRRAPAPAPSPGGGGGGDLA